MSTQREDRPGSPASIAQGWHDELEALARRMGKQLDDWRSGLPPVRDSGDPTPVQPVGKVTVTKVEGGVELVDPSAVSFFGPKRDIRELVDRPAEATVEHCKVAEIMLDAKSGDMPQPWRRVTIGLLVDALSRNEHATAAVRDSNDDQAKGVK
jgi:hypothetical protein